MAREKKLRGHLRKLRLRGCIGFCKLSVLFCKDLITPLSKHNDNLEHFPLKLKYPEFKTYTHTHTVVLTQYWVKYGQSQISCPNSCNVT